jgi:hypothetical protein
LYRYRPSNIAKAIKKILRGNAKKGRKIISKPGSLWTNDLRFDGNNNKVATKTRRQTTNKGSRTKYCVVPAIVRTIRMLAIAMF